LLGDAGRAFSEFVSEGSQQIEFVNSLVCNFDKDFLLVLVSVDNESRLVLEKPDEVVLLPLKRLV